MRADASSEEKAGRRARRRLRSRPPSPARHRSSNSTHGLVAVRLPRRVCGARPRETTDESGVALVTTLATVALVLGLTAGTVLTARSDLVLFRNARDGVTTYYRAHGAAVLTVAGLPAGYSFDGLLRGPDGTPSTADDGTAGASSLPGCQVAATDDLGDPDPSPMTDGNRRIRLTTRCEGPGGSVRRLEWTVGRAVGPFAPAALYLERADVQVTAPVTLDGRDHLLGDAPGFPTGSDSAVPAVASPGLSEPLPLPPDIVDGDGSAVAMVPVPGIDMPALGSLAVGGAPPLVAGVLEGPLPTGLHFVVGDARVVGATTGEGLLIVDGDLTVDATLDYAGVVMVRGALRIGADGHLVVRGSLWLEGRTPDRALSAAGPLTVLYSKEGVAGADGVLALPRRAVALAQRDG